MLFAKKKSEPIILDERLKHIAFIMDGNGRWAKQRGLPREVGHRYGAANFRKIGRYCQSIGLKYMTVYAFSTENWKRPESEVKALMKLFDEYIEDCFKDMAEDSIHVNFIGNLSAFPKDLQEKMQRIEENTRDKSFLLNIALNYGGREEIVHACNQLIKSGKTEVSEADICNSTYTAGCPDPDLIVRTGGDLRTSNFLLWQSAYAEYFFTKTLWPDLTPDEVDTAIREFYSRKRRFGGI